MKYILSIIVFIVGLTVLNCPALVASEDVTSSNFVINLAPMDPIKSDRASPPGGVEALKSLLGSISSVLIYTVFLLAAICFIVAGYFYILSAGDSEKAGRAKNIIKFNLISIFVSLFSYAIVRLIASFFA